MSESRLWELEPVKLHFRTMHALSESLETKASVADLDFEAGRWLNAVKPGNDGDRSCRKHPVPVFNIVGHCADTIQKHRAKLHDSQEYFTGANAMDAFERKSKNLFRTAAAGRCTHLNASDTQPTMAWGVDNASERENCRVLGSIDEEHNGPSLDRQGLSDLIASLSGSGSENLNMTQPRK